MSNNLYEWYKKIVADIKKTPDWKSVPYLQGVIISFKSSIEQLQKENDDLRNNKGIWLSSEKVNELKLKLKDISEDLV